MAGVTTKGAATRQHIIESATQVFARQGYAGTRMDDVIAAAELTKGAVYFHFRSKEELAHSVVTDLRQRWLRRIVAILDGIDSPAAQLRAIAAGLIQLSHDDPATWEVVRLAAEVGHDTNPIEEWVELIAGLVARGQADGSFTTTADPTDFAVVVVGAFDGLKTVSGTIADEGDAAFDRRARLLLEIIERALA